MTDDSAFKKQVRARMAETGEKYTAARRMVVEDAAIRAAVRRSADQAGVSAVDIDRTTDRLRVGVRAARPILLAGRLGEDADRLRGELEELTGRRVQLNIRETPAG